MRVDVREQTERAAAAELETNDTHIVLFARPLADDLRVWSEPVQIMVAPGHNGLLTMILRKVES